MHKTATLRTTALFAVLLVASIAAVSAMAAPVEYGPQMQPPRSFGAVLHPNWINAVVELISNGSFETGTFAGWTVVNAGAGVGDWFVTDQPTVPLSLAPIPPASDGLFQAVVDQTGPGSHILYQDVFVPIASSVSLNMILWAENYAGGYSDPGSLDSNVIPNQQARVDIMNPGAPVDDVGAGVLLNVFKTNAGDPTSIPYTPLFANLNAFQGQTIRLRIVEVDNQFFFNVGVDAVSIQADVVTETAHAGWGTVKARYR